MCYTNILSRRINLEFINLGFSGNGKGEPEVARLIASIPTRASSCWTTRPTPWASRDLRRTLPEFLRILRARIRPCRSWRSRRSPMPRRPFIPTRRRSPRQPRLPAPDDRRPASRRRSNVHFLDGSDLLGEGWQECTVDSVHPNDLGFLRMADSLEPVLKKILKMA